MIKQPRFPLTVRFADGDKVVVADELDAECNLEWLDSDDLEDPIEVKDADGRRVRLRIEKLKIQTLELMHSAPLDEADEHKSSDEEGEEAGPSGL